MIHARIAYPHVEARACRELWCAVLLTALRDLCQPGGKSPQRDAAERWVGDWPDQNFRMVCHLAGIDPDWLHGALDRLVKKPVAERRHHLATLLDCPPGRIGSRLMVRQEAFEEPDCTVPKAGQGVRETDPVPLSAGDRRNRVAAMFRQGVAPTDMSHAFAVQGHNVSMATLWNDIRVLRSAGRIGYAKTRGSTGKPACSSKPIHHIEEEKT